MKFVTLPDQQLRFVVFDLPYVAILVGIGYTSESTDPICHRDVFSRILRLPKRETGSNK